MKQLTVMTLTMIMNLQTLFGGFADFHYQGVNPDWEFLKNSPLEIVKTLIPENPIIFEVGAKDGEDSAVMAALWPKGTIISFEANPHQFSKYLKKAAVFSNMKGYNLAVNTYEGEADFYLCWGTGGTDPIFEGASSLLEASRDMAIHYMGPIITVPCVIFDNWCKQQSIEEIDFVWLDLEGFELQFLKSSPDILKTVKVIYTETNFFEFRKGTTQFEELRAFLQSEGFEMIAHWYLEGLQGDAIFLRR